LLERWLRPVFESGAPEPATHALPPGAEWALMALSVAVAGVGIAFALRAYLREPEVATRLRERLAIFHRAVLNKYWVDELYDAIAVSPVVRLARRLWTFWDVKIVDGAVNGVAATFEAA